MATLAFSNRMRAVNADGTLTRDFWKLIEEILSRTGGAVAALDAADINNTPNGDVAAITVQSAIDELDLEKQPKDATLTALAALSFVADRLAYSTGADAFALATLTSYARTLLDDVDAAAARSTLGLGSIATQATSNVSITGGTIALASGSLGYATGSGGTVTQTIGKANNVTLNKITGEITMDASALAANTTVTFIMDNSTIAPGDRIVLNHVSGGTFGSYNLDARADFGAALIAVRNITSGALSEGIVIGFTVIKSATS